MVGGLQCPFLRGLGNSSGEVVRADVEFGSGIKRHIDLQPFATRLEPFAYGSEGTSPKGRISSTFITYSGAPERYEWQDSLHPCFEHFFDTVRFVDPKLSTNLPSTPMGFTLKMHRALGGEKPH